jgi:hypothetical protein
MSIRSVPVGLIGQLRGWLPLTIDEAFVSTSDDSIAPISRKSSQSLITFVHFFVIEKGLTPRKDHFKF